MVDVRRRVADHVEILQDETFTVVGLFANGDPRLEETCENTLYGNGIKCNSRKRTIAEHH